TEKYVYQTSWGMTTRLIGATVMVHGDDKGLRLPPRVAPIQAVIVPIIFDATKATTLEACARIEKELLDGGIRVKLDSRDWVTSGFKFNDWELRGVPIRVEIGPKDLEKNQAMLVRRDTREKTPVPLGELAAKIQETLNSIQANLLAEAEAFRD